MEVLEAVRSRASVRFFREDPIPEDLIREILEAGIRAPNAGGAEQWFFVVVKSEEKRREIHRLLLRAHLEYFRSRREPLPEEKLEKLASRIERGMYRAPLYIAAYVDLRRKIMRDEYGDIEWMMALESVSAAIENMILAAWSRGIGSVWLGVPVLLEEEFDRILKPPRGTKLAAIVAFGYPGAPVKPRRRRPLEEVSIEV